MGYANNPFTKTLTLFKLKESDAFKCKASSTELSQGSGIIGGQDFVESRMRNGMPPARTRLVGDELNFPPSLTIVLEDRPPQ